MDKTSNVINRQKKDFSTNLAMNHSLLLLKIKLRFNNLSSYNKSREKFSMFPFFSLLGDLKINSHANTVKIGVIVNNQQFHSKSKSNV